MANVARHETGSFDLWRENHASAVERAAAYVRSLPELPEAAGTVAQLAAERACLASLRPGAEDEIRDALRLAAHAAAAAFVSASRDEGEVQTAFGGAAVVWPVTGPCSVAHVGTWLLGFSTAVLSRHERAARILRSDAAVESALASGTRGDDFWEPLARMLGALSRRDDDAADTYAADARTRIENGGAGVGIDPGFARATKLPLVDLGETLARGGAADWDARVAAALESHRAYWGNDENAQDPYGFLAFDLAALCALARERGLVTHVASPYLPELRPGDAAPVAAPGILYVFPRRKLRDVAGAHRFMAAHGGDGARAAHEVIERDGVLLAVYDCAPAGDGPSLRFEFEWTDGDEPANPPSDPAEHLRLADEASHGVPASPEKLSPEERAAAGARLEEAIGHLRATLACIPPGGEAVPEELFRSPESRAFRRAEPGRFRRARLEAVLAAWSRLLESFGAPGENAARRQALAAMTVVRQQVQPILQTILESPAAAIAARFAPRERDYDAVFLGEAVPAARLFYDRLFAEGLEIPRRAPSPVELRAFVCPAGMFRHENELSGPFPSGYRAIAPWLNPHCVWIAWKAVAPGQTSGLAFDGLVWCEDRWTWFPKPYRALAPLVERRGGAGARPPA